MYMDFVEKGVLGFPLKLNIRIILYIKSNEKTIICRW